MVIRLNILLYAMKGLDDGGNAGDAQGNNSIKSNGGVIVDTRLNIHGERSQRYERNYGLQCRANLIRVISIVCLPLLSFGKNTKTFLKNGSLPVVFAKSVNKCANVSFYD